MLIQNLDEERVKSIQFVLHVIKSIYNRPGSIRNVFKKGNFVVMLETPCGDVNGFRTRFLELQSCNNLYPLC